MSQTHQILFRLNDCDYEKLLKDVEKTGLTREAYLRDLVREKQPKELPPIQFQDVLRELRQINVNMNQIAMKAHTLNFIDAPFYSQCHKDLQASVGKIMRAVYG